MSRQPRAVQPSLGARVAVEMGDSYLGGRQRPGRLSRGRGVPARRPAAGQPAVERNRRRLPEGTNFGFNGADGRTWIDVFGPGGSLGREVSREVLNTALVSLGRPGLGS